MSKARSYIRLEVTTTAYLHYLLEKGETDSLYGIIDLLVKVYMESFVAENNLKANEVLDEAMKIYQKTRRPQSKKSKEEQLTSVRKSLGKLNAKRKVGDMLGEVNIEPGSLKGNF